MAQEEEEEKELSVRFPPSPEERQIVIDFEKGEKKSRIFLGLEKCILRCGFVQSSRRRWSLFPCFQKKEWTRT